MLDKYLYNAIITSKFVRESKVMGMRVSTEPRCLRTLRKYGARALNRLDPPHTIKRIESDDRVPGQQWLVVRGVRADVDRYVLVEERPGRRYVAGQTIRMTRDRVPTVFDLLDEWEKLKDRIDQVASAVLNH
jgi:hypothetical protein